MDLAPMNLAEAIATSNRAVLEQRARRILYPDERAPYAEHTAMLAMLADTLEQLERLAARGGGELHVLRVRGGEIEGFSAKRQPVGATLA
jgi:hypothetical protein